MAYTMETLPPAPLGRVVALGNFDGVHRGHRAILTAARKEAEANSLPVTVWSFATLPKAAITPPSLREEILLRAGADQVVYDTFDRVRDMAPEIFVREVLASALGATVCVCGFNYSFGKGGKGDAALLKTLCRGFGITCRVVPAVTVEGQAVSSSRIRQLLGEGRMEEVASLLGWPYRYVAPVESGRGFGRTMGLPTLNQRVEEGVCLPRRGVYATACRVGDRVFPAVTNLGVCPTLTAGDRLAIETHLLDFDGSLYGETVEVSFLRFLREERTFPSVEALKAEIERNRREALRLFAACGKREDGEPSAIKL